MHCMRKFLACMTPYLASQLTCFQGLVTAFLTGDELALPSVWVEWWEFFLLVDITLAHIVDQTDEDFHIQPKSCERFFRTFYNTLEALHENVFVSKDLKY